MSTPEQPNTTNLCGEFAALTDAESDQGRAYSAPIVQDCAIPAGLTIDEETDVTYDEDGNPGFGPAPEESDVSSSVDVTIESVEDLAAIETVDIEIGSAGAVRMWIDEATGTFQVWQLESGTDAHDPLNGVVRPDDYNAVTNAKVWIKRN